MCEVGIYVHGILLIFDWQNLISEMLHFKFNLRYVVDERARDEEDRQGGDSGGSVHDRCNKVIIATIIRRFRASQ